MIKPRTPLHSLRLKTKLSVYDVADALGVRPGTYRAWEYGNATPRDVGLQRALARYWERPIGKLLPSVNRPALAIADQLFPTRLRAMRVLERKTAAEMAFLLGVAPSTYKAWENAQAIPLFERQIQLEKRFGFGIKALLRSVDCRNGELIEFSGG